MSQATITSACPAFSGVNHFPGVSKMIDRIKTAAFVLFLFCAYGAVGHLDYEAEIRAAAEVCERQYGQNAVFIETDEGWECASKASQI